MTPNEKHRDTYLGHRDARLINSKEYQDEKAAIARFVNTYKHELFFEPIIDKFESWLSNADRRRIGQCMVERRYLWKAGVRGADVLIEATAIWLYGLRNPYKIKGERHRQYLIGYKVLRLPNKNVSTTGIQHRVIGANVIMSFRSVIENICKLFEHSREKHTSAVKDMATPLKIKGEEK